MQLKQMRMSIGELVCELPFERNLMEATKASSVIAGIHSVTESSATLKCSTLTVDINLYKGTLGG